MNSIKFNQQGIKDTKSKIKTNTRRPIKKFFNDNKTEYKGSLDGYEFQSIQGFQELVAVFYNEEKEHALFAPIKYKVGETIFVQESNITLDEFCGYCGHFTNKNINYGCTHKDCGDIGKDYDGKDHGRCFSWSCPIVESYEDESDSSFDGDTYVWLPKEYSKVFLKIKSIKVERLQDISEDDCIKEGVRHPFIDAGGQVEEDCMQQAFKREFWNNLPYKKPYDWDSNRYVFVYEFELVEEK